MLTRRDTIAAFLGATAAELSCRSSKTPHLTEIPGQLVDRMHEVGHLLRPSSTAPALTLNDAPAEALEVAIVGSGVAALSAAWRLKSSGVTNFAIFELDEVIGGTSRHGENAVSRFPWGAHYLPAPLTAEGPVARVLKELGLLVGVDERGQPQYAEQTLIHEPEERLFYRGLWYEGLYLRAGALPDDLAQLKRFEQKMSTFASSYDAKKRKAFDVPIERGSDDAEWTQLDSLSMAQWLETERFTSERLRWMVEYACRDDYGASAAETSAWAGIWYFSARQSGVAKNDGYLSWPEGNGHLVAHLAKSAQPDQLRLNSLVHTLERAADGEWLVHLIDAKTKAPKRVRAKSIICAAPRFVAGHLISEWRRERPSWLGEFQYSPWVVANVTVKSLPRSQGFPISWDNVLYGSKSLGYVVATHQQERGHSLGPSVLTWYYPLAEADVRAQREKLLSASLSDWQQIVMADLRPAHIAFDSVVQNIDVMRWGHAMIRPRPGFVWGKARAEAQQSLGSLHFAHSDLGGLALFEEANWHGVRAAEAAMTSLNRQVETWL